MIDKIVVFLKTPIIFSDQSKRLFLILKRIVLFLAAVSLSAIALPQGVLMMIFRIDMWQELQMVTKADLLAGPIASLIIILFAHEYLPEGKIRRIAIFFYLFIALFVSSFFLMLHINQVSVRGGESQIAIIRSLLKNDK